MQNVVARSTGKNEEKFVLLIVMHHINHSDHSPRCTLPQR
jgi:hypothetical protein